MRFAGTVYDPAFDSARLEKQLGRIYDCMKDGQYRTLSEISKITGDHEASISAQLRNLKKYEFGGYTLHKRRRGDRSQGLWEYQILKPELQPEFQFLGMTHAMD